MICWYESSEFADYDHPWPTAPEEVQKVATWFAEGDTFLAVTLRDTGHFIGFFALNPEHGESVRTFNIGYIMDPDYHGKGYAAEAGRALLDYAFNQLQAGRVITGTAVANRASCRLLERLGFRKIGESMSSFRKTEDGTPIEFSGCQYALSKEEWVTQ
jgi:RimJ/RimL family protein N-acetyltransferase